MNKKDARINRILTLLAEKNAISIHTLSQTLQVSEMTIRRDFVELESTDCISVIQGVAILKRNPDGSPVVKEYALTSERNIMAQAKYRIGRAATELLEPDDVIIIDTGTTTEYLSENLPSIPISVICYNLNTLVNIQKQGIKNIIFSGGYFHENTQMFESPEGISLISRSCANKFFCSAAGINSKGAVTCVDQYEMNTKQASIHASQTKILLMDSSKFGKIRPCLFANIKDFDLLITDDGIPEEWRELLRIMEIEYRIV